MNPMAFLLRVELPDVPGSLGAVASALGSVGADIEAIEIVEHRADGVAVDDVLCELPSSVQPDALVSACQRLEGVKVLWVSRYTAAASLQLDLEAVETLTERPAQAVSRLAEVVPATFRCDWAMVLRLAGASDPKVEVVGASGAAPEPVTESATWLVGDRPRRLPEVAGWPDTLLAIAPLHDADAWVVLGRRGGPELLDSELARLGHLAALATSISAAG
jgi:hypothetical protein